MKSTQKILLNLNRMQEKQRIQEQLQQLQIECVKQYLENNLQAITTKEVVSDILQGFIQYNNVEFMQNIAESILEAKVNQKNLKQEIEKNKINHQLELQELKAQVTQQRDLDNQRKYNQIILALRQHNNSLTLQIKEEQTKNQELKAQNKVIKDRMEELTKEYIAAEIKTIETVQAKNKDYQQITKNLSDMKEVLFQKERQSSDNIQRLITQKEVLNSKINQLSKSLQQVQSDYGSAIQRNKDEKATLERQLQELKQANQSTCALLAATIQKKEVTENDLKNLQHQKGLLEEEKHSLSVSHQYLKEENQYLREEIITFNKRQRKLTEEKQKLKQDIDRLIQTSNHQIEQLNILKLNLQQQLKQSLTDLQLHHQSQLSTLRAEIQRLEAHLLKLQRQRQQIESQLNSRQQQLNDKQTQLVNQREQNKCLHTQINFHFEQNQVHEREIQRYEGQLLKVNQQCRAQLDTFKQTYELNWNALNEELIEQKYSNQQLQEQIDSLKEELELQRDKEKFYSMYVEEISHLKRQLGIVTSNKKFIFSRSELKFEDNKAKFYFFLSKIKEELQGLKQQNRQLKDKFIKQALTYKAQFQDNLSYLVAKIKQQYLKCSYCEHQKILGDKGRQKERTNLGFEKTLPKVTLVETSSLSTLKKSMRSIQQRYQAVNQENKFYTEHLNSIMRNA